MTSVFLLFSFFFFLFSFFFFLFSFFFFLFSSFFRYAQVITVIVVVSIYEEDNTRRRSDVVRVYIYGTRDCHRYFRRHVYYHVHLFKESNYTRTYARRIFLTRSDFNFQSNTLAWVRYDNVLNVVLLFTVTWIHCQTVICINDKAINK